MTPEERAWASKLQRIRRDSDPDRSDHVRDMNLRRKFGITLDQYLDMVVGQGGKCKICGTFYGDIGKALAVDHDHETGEIRGLVCQRCNTLIGFIDKNFDLLQNVYEYLGIDIHKNINP